MKLWGVVLAGAGLFVLFIALAYDPTVLSGGELYGSDRVVNVQRLQVQMMTFIGGLATILLGGIMIIGGYVVEALRERTDDADG